MLQLMEYFGLPSARISVLMEFPIKRNGKPNAVIPRYALAYGKTVSVAPHNQRIGVLKTSTRIMMETPKTAISVSPVPTNFLASSSCFAPMLMLKLEAVPIPAICANAMVSVTTGKATFVAALPRIPTT